MSTEVIAAPQPAGRAAEVSPSILKTLAGLVFAVGFGFAAFGWGVAQGVRGTDLTLLALALLTLVVGFLPLILDSGRAPERRNVIITMVGILYGVQFSIPVFFHYIPAVGPTDPPGMSFVDLMPDDVARAQLLGLIGLLAIYAGNAIPVRRVVSQVLPPARHEWTERGTLAAALILIPVGWGIYLLQYFGLYPSWLGSGLVGGFTDLTLVAPALLTAAFLRYRSRLTLLMLIIVPITSGFNFLSSSKNLILMPWAMLFLTYIVYKRKVQLRWFVAGGVALVLLFPATAFVRDVVLEGNTRTLAQVMQDPGRALRSVSGYVGGGTFGEYVDEGIARTTSRVDALGHPAVIIRDTPSKVPYQDGRTIGLIFLSYIPRVVWPEKPIIGIGLWIQEKYNNSPIFVQSHLGPSWIGEFYLNFGTPGILLGMMWLGLIFRTWHEILTGRGSTIPLIVAEVVVIKDVILKLTGGLVAVVNGPVTGVIPFLGVHLLLRFLGATQRVDGAEGEETR